MVTIWGNVFFYLFLLTLIGLLGFVFFSLNKLNKNTSERKLLQQQYVARIDMLRKEHGEKIEKLRTEMLKREEDRSRQWMESEKETLRVLNGVSNLLDLSKKMGRVDSNKILGKLDEIHIKIEDLKNSKN